MPQPEPEIAMRSATHDVMREALAKLDHQANDRRVFSLSGSVDRFHSHFRQSTRILSALKGGIVAVKEDGWSGRRDLNPGPLAPQARIGLPSTP
ncbi:MAG: hypothetical protein ABSB67_17845 [Bryobacteraceae bacterium]|jgi:hypothetical protein